MAQRVTAECVTAQQHRINGEDKRADSDSENCLSCRRICKPHRFPGIMRKQEDKKERKIQKIAVHILHDERERSLAEVGLARLANRARGWISPKRFVVCAAIIIAGEPKSARSPEHQKRRRKKQPRWPPIRFRPKPTVRRSSKYFRRIKRGEIRSEEIVFSLQRGPRRVDDERPQTQKNEQRLRPPDIAPHRFAERAARQCDFGGSHRGRTLVAIPDSSSRVVDKKTRDLAAIVIQLCLVAREPRLGQIKIALDATESFIIDLLRISQGNDGLPFDLQCAML